MAAMKSVAAFPALNRLFIEIIC